jgi:large subunit ribosomal protein L25
LQARWPSPATRERAGAHSVRAQPPKGDEQSGGATFAQESKACPLRGGQKPGRKASIRSTWSRGFFINGVNMKFVAYERTLQGTGASRRLRNAHKVPGIVYGAGASAMIELDHNALFFALKKEAFHSSILEMELAGKSQNVLLRDYQMHPFQPIVLHVDFQRVDATTKVTKRVPLHFANEEHSPAVKTDKCLVNHVVTELMIQCLASQLPEFIAVDLSNLAKGQSLNANDIKLADGLKVMTHGKPNPVIVSVSVQAAEEEVVVAPGVAVPAAAPVKAKKTEKQNKK